MSLCPGFLLLGAALYFAGGIGAVAALGAAMLAHELGHLTALFLMDGRIRRFRFAMGGPVIEYEGALTEAQMRLITAAGPLAGLVFAVLCILTGRPFFLYTGAVALLTTAYNLLPALPLDGGRLTASLLGDFLPERSAALILRIAGSLCALGVAITGVCIGSIAAAAAGLWLAILVNVPKMR